MGVIGREHLFACLPGLLLLRSWPGLVCSAPRWRGAAPVVGAGLGWLLADRID